MYIYKIKSEFPITEYAPTWDISIGKSVWNDTEKIDNIREWLVNNEERIKSMYPVTDDSGTGLGINSLTSRVGKYNLFDFATELPELNDLLKFIQISYIEFININYSPAQELDLVCWVNILRNGQEIKEHVHSASNLAYLSANLHLDNYPTYTVYRSPYMQFEEHSLENSKGGLCIFPSYVPHKTTEYKELTTPRVSIACDLRLPNTTPPGYPKQAFMNKQIFDQLVTER